ncbi:B12-binding domain-containing radical SAM protein [Gorillibacterium sp. sgz500922]|uniref:B12-binding domain-containing radical SAM protein n=1 Tax=Gorillibacterium sp. sgz500922 TaxID=3446694 RepID=UPI003F6803FD
MNILVVSTNTLTQPLPVVPIGAGMIYSALKTAGYDTRFLDLAFQPEPLAALRDALVAEPPDLICLSVRNIDNQVIQRPQFFLPFVKEAAEVCRRHSQAPLVIGGAAMQVMPDEVLAYLGGDFGIQGYGEAELLRLVGELAAGRADPARKVRRAATAFFDPYSRLPERSLFADRYFEPNPRIKKAAMGYQASRGCSRACVYCSDGSPHLRGYCRVGAEPFEEDMAVLTRDYQVKSVTFVDGVFNHDIDGTMAFCETILKSRAVFDWSCALTPAHVSEEMVALMKRSGCRFVDLGLDTASEEMIERLGKHYPLPSLFRLAELLARYEIPYSVSLLFGGPGETRRTVAETIRSVNRLKPVYVLASTGIRVYPHTGLYETAVAEGAIGPEENLLLPRFYQSADFTPELLAEELADSAHEYKDMMMKPINERVIPHG